MYPEALPVREQMALIASAERIAGEQGSPSIASFFWIGRGISGLISLSGIQREDGPYNRNYDTIAERKGIFQNAIRIKSEIVQARKGKNVQKYSKYYGIS